MARREAVLAATLGALAGVAVLTLGAWLWLGRETPTPSAPRREAAAAGAEGPAALPLPAAANEPDLPPANTSQAAPAPVLPPPANQTAGRTPPPSLPPPVIDRIPPAEGEGEVAPPRPHAPNLTREAEMAHLDMQAALHILKAALR